MELSLILLKIVNPGVSFNQQHRPNVNLCTLLLSLCFHAACQYCMKCSAICLCACVVIDDVTWKLESMLQLQMVARCKEDIVKAKGVKPTLSANLNTLATVEALDVKKLLFIGVGCQVKPC